MRDCPSKWMAFVVQNPFFVVLIFPDWRSLHSSWVPQPRACETMGQMTFQSLSRSLSLWLGGLSLPLKHNGETRVTDVKQLENISKATWMPTSITETEHLKAQCICLRLCEEGSVGGETKSRLCVNGVFFWWQNRQVTVVPWHWATGRGLSEMGVEWGLQCPSAKVHADLGWPWSQTWAFVYFYPPSWPLMSAVSHFSFLIQSSVLSMVDDCPFVVILPFSAIFILPFLR